MHSSDVYYSSRAFAMTNVFRSCARTLLPESRSTCCMRFKNTQIHQEERLACSASDGGTTSAAAAGLLLGTNDDSAFICLCCKSLQFWVWPPSHPPALHSSNILVACIIFVYHIIRDAAGVFPGSNTLGIPSLRRQPRVAYAPQAPQNRPAQVPKPHAVVALSLNPVERCTSETQRAT